MQSTFIVPGSVTNYPNMTSTTLPTTRPQDGFDFVMKVGEKALTRKERKTKLLNYKLERIPHFDVVQKVKPWFEVARQRSCPQPKRAPLITQIIQEIAPVVNELSHQKEGSRIVQTCLRYCVPEQFPDLVKGILGNLFEIASLKHGRYVILSLVENVPVGSSIRKSVWKEIIQNRQAFKYLGSKNAAIVIDAVYNLSNKYEKMKILAAIYGKGVVRFYKKNKKLLGSDHAAPFPIPPQFENLPKWCSSPKHNILFMSFCDPLFDYQMTINFIEDVVEKFLTKSPEYGICHVIILDLLTCFYAYRQSESFLDLIVKLTDLIPFISHTPTGALLSSLAVAFSPAKIRKQKILQPLLKSHLVVPFIFHKEAIKPMIRLIATTDDAVSIRKYLLAPLLNYCQANNCVDLLFIHPIASKFILVLLTHPSRWVKHLGKQYLQHTTTVEISARALDLCLEKYKKTGAVLGTQANDQVTVEYKQNSDGSSVPIMKPKMKSKTLSDSDDDNDELSTSQTRSVFVDEENEILVSPSKKPRLDRWNDISAKFLESKLFKSFFHVMKENISLFLRNNHATRVFSELVFCEMTKADLKISLDISEYIVNYLISNGFTSEMNQKISENLGRWTQMYLYGVVSTPERNFNLPINKWWFGEQSLLFPAETLPTFSNTQIQKPALEAISDDDEEEGGVKGAEGAQGAQGAENQAFDNLIPLFSDKNVVRTLKAIFFFLIDALLKDAPYTISADPTFAEILFHKLNKAHLLKMATDPNMSFILFYLYRSLSPKSQSKMYSLLKSKFEQIRLVENPNSNSSTKYKSFKKSQRKKRDHVELDDSYAPGCQLLVSEMEKEQVSTKPTSRRKRVRKS